MEKLEFAQIQLEGALYVNAPFIRNSLRANQSSIYVDAELNKESIKNKDLTNLYEWKDGGYIPDQEHPLGYMQFCSWGYFVPLSVAIRLYKEFSCEILSRDDLFPFIASYSGEYLFIKVKGKRKGGVYAQASSLLINDPTLVYNSLRDFLDTVVDCYEKHVYSFDEQRCLEVDFDQEFEVSKKINSTIPYWHSENI